MVSIIISTYNWPEALKLCVESIFKQTTLPAEIIIADDGSKRPTFDVIKSLTKRSPVPIIHVWHPDEGFKLSQIRNKAIAKVSQQYIIQIDGDILLEKHFVEDHLNIAEQGYMVTGSRVNLSEYYSSLIIAANIIPPNSELRKNSTNYFNSLRIPMLMPFFAKRYKTKGKYLHFTRGCNMAYFKDDIANVNGYNEDMTGWGSEDTELVARMLQNGVKKKFIKLGGIGYHIWHPFASRKRATINDEIYKETIKQKLTWVENGLNKY